MRRNTVCLFLAQLVASSFLAMASAISAYDLYRSAMIRFGYALVMFWAVKLIQKSERPWLDGLLFGVAALIGNWVGLRLMRF